MDDEEKGGSKFVAETSSAIKHKFTVLLILFQVRTCAKLFSRLPNKRLESWKFFVSDSNSEQLLLCRVCEIVWEGNGSSRSGLYGSLPVFRAPNTYEKVFWGLRMRTREETINNHKVLRLTSNYNAIAPQLMKLGKREKLRKSETV